MEIVTPEFLRTPSAERDAWLKEQLAIAERANEDLYSVSRSIERDRNARTHYAALIRALLEEPEEWEWRVLFNDGCTGVVCSSVADANEYRSQIADQWREGSVIKRRRKAGKWEPVEERE